MVERLRLLSFGKKAIMLKSEADI